MENKKPWKKLSARSQDVLHWDANILVRREKVKLGQIYFGSRNDLVVKNNAVLPVFYAQNPPIAERTNLGEYCNAISSELNEVLDQAIVTIDKSLGVEAGKTREDAKLLYECFKENMGLMLFGLICNIVPATYLKESIGDRFEELKDQILRPHRLTLLGREAQSIQAIQIEGKGKTEEWFKEQAQELVEKFGFIHSEFVSESWTKEDYIREFEATGISIHENVSLNSSNFSEYDTWLVTVIQRMAYLLDEGKSALVRANWALRNTFKNLGYSDDLLRLTEAEFYAWVEDGVLPEAHVLIERRTHFAIGSVGDTYTFLSGKEAVETLVKNEGLEEEVYEGVATLSGSTAAKGYIKGRVVLVFTQEDCKKLNEGDILVASMTTPAYIEAMRRAGAFVTDEGGIICHAAIVAREFKKPCIVGTRIATKVLKDGDLVEVDADKGIVTILERKA